MWRGHLFYQRKHKRVSLWQWTVQTKILLLTRCYFTLNDSLNHFWFLKRPRAMVSEKTTSTCWLRQNLSGFKLWKIASGNIRHQALTPLKLLVMLEKTSVILSTAWQQNYAILLQCRSESKLNSNKFKLAWFQNWWYWASFVMQQKVREWPQFFQLSDAQSNKTFPLHHLLLHCAFEQAERRVLCFFFACKKMKNDVHL